MLKAPIPYYGGKSRIADEVWKRFGSVQNSIEPFFGSGAVLLGRPNPSGIETVNDIDGMVSNFWRALQQAPDEVSYHVDWPVNENDLHARHIWLVNHKPSITAQLEGDPDWYDAKAAGWWAWGMSCWIGSGFCSGQGPWQSVDGLMTKVERDTAGVSRQLPHLGTAGKGVNRQLPHLGDAGQGVKRKLPHLGNAGKGVNRKGDLYAYMQALADRMRDVRVCCGDWSRICGLSPTTNLGLTAVFLDPPYSEEAGRDMGLYAHESGTVAHEVRDWAIAHGDDPLMRIALCGYDGEHPMPEGWTEYRWKTQGGYGNQGDVRGRKNAEREVVWFSPHCLKQDQVQAPLWKEEIWHSR